MKSYENININAEQITKAIHESIGGVFPSISMLLEWAEHNIGYKIKVFHFEPSSIATQCSGFVYFDQANQTHKVWINSEDPKCRQNFTVCHEIAHILRNSGIVYGCSTGDIYSDWGEERFCNRFAAAFLMPSELFIKEWKDIKDNDILKVPRLACRFKVSGDAVTVRAKELKLI